MTKEEHKTKMIERRKVQLARSEQPIHRKLKLGKYIPAGEGKNTKGVKGY